MSTEDDWINPVQSELEYIEILYLSTLEQPESLGSDQLNVGVLSVVFVSFIGDNPVIFAWPVLSTVIIRVSVWFKLPAASTTYAVTLWLPSVKDLKLL